MMYLTTQDGKLIKGRGKYYVVPIEYYTVSASDFSTNYNNRLGGLTSEAKAIKIPSHVKSGTLTTQLWNCANENTKYITFTDEEDFALTRFDTANNNTITTRDALLSITNLPSTVTELRIHAPNIKSVCDVSHVKTFYFTSNTVMTTLDGIVGLSDNENITTLKLQSNTGLVDLSNFIIPENVTALTQMFKGCSALSKARLDYNYSTLNTSNLMFQNTAIKHLDIYADAVETTNMFAGYNWTAGAVEIRCNPNTNTWSYWKNFMESNDTPFYHSGNVAACHYCIHSFANEQKTISVWGDSLTRGGDGTTYSDLCIKLSNMLTSDCIVQNLGQGGVSAAQQVGYFNAYDIGWNDINVLFYGHNTPETTIDTYNEYYIPHLTKYIVLGLVTKNYSTAMNNQMAEEYGSQFVDTHAYMIQNGFAITGLTPTAQDEEDLANGRVPHSFLASDYIHINEYGGLIVATAIKEKLLALGYIDNTWLA